MHTIKSFNITKQMVWYAYERVKANKGAAGVDEQSISDFEDNLKDNLYKLWNRLSSGSYLPPPVRMVEIPKSNGGTRTLGIPTVADRIAQMVAKLYLEPQLEPYFDEDSYGYRPFKSALNAIAAARKRCWKYDWALDLDIQGFFDNLDHELLMRAVRKHTNCKWLLLYIERWLKAPMELADGQLQKRSKGTPQGGVISPLLANLFLHYALDKWMRWKYPHNPFERYADDMIIHCKNVDETNSLKKEIAKRLKECKLKLHPEKTKIVYCKDDNRRKEFKSTQFDFLGYTFRPRLVRNREGKFFVSFAPAISNKAAKSIRQEMKKWNLHSRSNRSLEELANEINPILKGWMNYYGYFQKSAMTPIYRILNINLSKWAKKKYKGLSSSIARAKHWLGKVARQKPTLFVHWRIGAYPTT